jgi:16S rRNA processing protein RimM
VGYVRAPWGIRGDVLVDALTDFPQRFQPGATFLTNAGEYTVQRARPHKGAIAIQFQHIDTRNQAEALRGLLLEIPEAEISPLAEGQYYQFQIVGIDVVDAQGNALGRIEEVLQTGANDVYVVRNDEGELLVPAIDSVVRHVDIEAGRMVVEPPAGLERRPLKQPGDRPARLRRRPRRTPPSAKG